MVLLSCCRTPFCLAHTYIIPFRMLLIEWVGSILNDETTGGSSSHPIYLTEIGIFACPFKMSFRYKKLSKTHDHKHVCRSAYLAATLSRPARPSRQVLWRKVRRNIHRWSSSKLLYPCNASPICAKKTPLMRRAPRALFSLRGKSFMRCCG